ncbi:SDR family NAD(P)-dependent oxidoreductase [Mycobacterium sp. 1274761.0]|uniref:SDR family NAD(P)-dependent oxidoreductase n=1 Tax=Mycobacterium sp. 1274761.0 TaxID=1834077 RepID=UPI000800C859|nr:SDR family NAD(P)-dependent oxidoreductase [Mycobacterium sp. 1274761.0]OBK73257.1 oxidoreductase [Mycobacterium sp. 1274761.0]
MAELFTTPFGFESTAADVIDGVDLTGRTAIVTGASSGIGVETARALSAAGATVTLAVRNTAEGQRVADEIRADTGNRRVSVGEINLSDLASVAAFVRAWTGPLDILVNNAGVMAVPELTLAASGHELHFATNHLGHFALAIGLHDALAAADGARVVSVSSGGHLRSPVVFDDIDYAFRDYDRFGAYGQSKTANVLFAVEATRRWADDGITANALMPGAIFDTRLGRHVDAGHAAAAATQLRLKTVEQGAATSVLLAASPLLDGTGGRYFEDCNEARLVDRRGAPGTGGVAPYALDPANAERLWDVSVTMTD